MMGGNVQCPVCTLFLLPGMDLSDHLETHPKEQVIKALVQLSLKSEVSETVTPDTPKKISKITFTENGVNNQATEDERTTPTSESSGSGSSGLPLAVEVHEKRREVEDNIADPPVPQSMLLSRQCGYLFENNNSSSSSSSSNFFGPPTPYYHHNQHHHHHNHNHHQHQHQQQQQQPQQQHHHNNQQNYHPYHGHPHGGNNSTMGAQPPLRLFSYQPSPKPLQPPPAYGAAISQLRSQNSQNLLVNNANRPLCSPGSYTPTSSSSSSSSLSTTQSRLPPPLPPPPLNQRYQPNFPQMETAFTDTCDNSAMSPRRTSLTPPIRPPPQLYRSPLSSNGQYSRQSSSPYSVMTGSPSVLRFAESPVTAHYLERENGDFIVQETPKHVVECVEKDDGEFSVIERVYHMPPSVVQINEDHDDNLSEHGSSSEDIKMLEDDRPSGTWSGEESPEQGQMGQQRQQKKSGITVLSDVQLDLNEYLDLMGNIIASSKVAKNRTEMIKIEKFEPEEVKEETGGAICFDDEGANYDISQDNDEKLEESEVEQKHYSNELMVTITQTAESPVTPGTTSVIRLAANPNPRSNTPPTPAKEEEAVHVVEIDTPATSVAEVVQTTIVDTEVAKVEGPEQTTSTDTITSKTEEIMEATDIDTSAALVLEAVQATSISTPTSEHVEPMPTATSTNTAITKIEEAMQTTNIVDLKPQSQLSLSQEDKPEKAEVAERQDKQEKQEKHEKKLNEEKQAKKIESPPILAYHQSIKRPIKKAPRKLVIKPRSKESVTSHAAPQPRIPTPTLLHTPTPSTSTESSPLGVQKEEILSDAPEKTQGEEVDCIKEESLPLIASDSIPPPLFADADEKLPPDDDVQPSTSNILAREAEAAPSNSSSQEKPAADLSAFLDQCMKKEEIEDHPMHSIFGVEIEVTADTLDEVLTPPPPPGFPSSSLFSKPLTTSEHLSMSESAIPDSSDIQDQDQHQPRQQQSNSAYVEYPFSFLYGGEANHQEDNKHDISPPMYCTEDFNKYSASTSGGNSASCTWYQSQSSENDFEIDGKGSYLDLDSCKRSASFAAATEGSMPTADTLNIRTDEKMPAKGEISEQESNCGVENSWSQPLYNEFPVRFPNPYQNVMTTHESWSYDHYFRPQDLSSSVETKNFDLRLTEESPIMDTLPSTSKRKNKATTKVPRKKTFQCAHCNTHFPLLKEKNAHLIKQHGYKRVNRRLIRDPPTSTVTTATMNIIDAGASLLLGLEPSALPPPPLAEEEDSKAAIVKIEQENQEQKDTKKGISTIALTTTAPPSSASISRTKYDSMRARDNRMLINFNLNALNVKNEGDAQSNYMESKSSFCCFVCRRDFLTVKLFDEHLAEHPAECFTCHKKFTRWKNFMVHLKRHLGWKDFGCTFCDKKFVIRSALVEHMRMHTGQTPLKCKICGKSFKRYSNLTQHRKRHGTKINRTKEYVCYCGEVLPSKARFIWHKETHDVKPKCCPYCRDRFVHANSLRRHIRLAHSDKFDYTEPMECPMCKQIYAKSSIKAHMATHSMDTQHECLICSKSFSTKWNLKIHNWVHANRTTKPYKCDQCVKAFVREVDYNNHINSHKQIKPYTCEHCGCKFIRKYNYIRHRREHHGNKKFTCDLCGKLFHRHYYLIEHRRIHTGERPFQCTICGKSSTTKTNHNKHLKIHHSRDPFTSEA